MIKTLEELRNATDEEILACTGELKNHSKDFEATFKTDYSYGTFTGELRARGYVIGWHKPSNKSDECKQYDLPNDLPISDNKVSLTLNVTKECEEKYEKFIANKMFDYLHNTLALEKYMEDYESGKIKVSISL